MADRSPKRTWPCRYEGCGSLFKKRAHLIRHELIHTDERPYICTAIDCGKAFRTTSHLKRHEATHGGEKTFRCSFEACQVACITEWNLKRHIKRTHLGKFKCKTCGQEFKKNKLLHQHVSMEHKTSTIGCSFPGCNQIFAVPAKMRHHMKVHTGKGYVCSVKGCTMKFQLWSECLQHAALCKKKELKCDVCSKVFTERSNLKAHEKIHSEEREVFQCMYDGCGRFYTKQCNLKVHIQSFHQNIRPFVCPKKFCSKSFHFQHLLRRHLDNHPKNDQDKEKEHKKRKRSKRMVTSTISGISGYIPELWNKMTAAEIDAFLDKDNSGCANDTEVYPADPDSTQVEMTPMTSSEFTSAATDVGNSQTEAILPDEDGSQEMLPYCSEETLTAVTTEMDITDEDCPMILERFESLDEACVHLNRMNGLKRQFSGTSSTGSSTPPTVVCTSEDAIRLAELGDRIKIMVEQRRESNGSSTSLVSSNIRESCHLQSVTESDSSDGEVQKKVQLILQQCAS